MNETIQKSLEEFEKNWRTQSGLNSLKTAIDGFSNLSESNFKTEEIEKAEKMIILYASRVESEAEQIFKSTLKNQEKVEGEALLGEYKAFTESRIIKYGYGYYLVRLGFLNIAPNGKTDQVRKTLLEMDEGTLESIIKIL